MRSSARIKEGTFRRSPSSFASIPPFSIVPLSHILCCSSSQLLFFRKEENTIYEMETFLSDVLSKENVLLSGRERQWEGKWTSPAREGAEDKAKKDARQSVSEPSSIKRNPLCSWLSESKIFQNKGICCINWGLCRHFGDFCSTFGR